jgi:type IV pilus assembly protein PilO
VDGTFHEIATFFDALGRLRRIVNVSDIVLESPKDVNGRVVVKSSFVATTFMFVDPKTVQAAPKGKAKGAR